MHVKSLLVVGLAASAYAQDYPICTAQADCDSSSLCTAIKDSTGAATSVNRCVPSCLVSSCVSKFLSKSATGDAYPSCTSQFDCAAGSICTSVKSDTNTGVMTTKCIPNCMIPSCYVSQNANAAPPATGVTGTVSSVVGGAASAVSSAVGGVATGVAGVVSGVGSGVGGLLGGIRKREIPAVYVSTSVVTVTVTQTAAPTAAARRK
ncbi:hypothetical protein HDV00_002310 [Rhizophlyctis rosea]|nr:hypothetical protein HDV00_002310 [Rhizophlyctis rosea]